MRHHFARDTGLSDDNAFQPLLTCGYISINAWRLQSLCPSSTHSEGLSESQPGAKSSDGERAATGHWLHCSKAVQSNNTPAVPPVQKTPGSGVSRVCGQGSPVHWLFSSCHGDQGKTGGIRASLKAVFTSSGSGFQAATPCSCAGFCADRGLKGGLGERS